MKKFVLFYVDVGCIDPESFIFSEKNINSAFAFSKRFCKECNKTFLGVVDYRIITKCTLL